MTCALYRHFDADGVLLYVGISERPDLRLRQHIKSASWPVAEVTLQWFECRSAAEVAELKSIAKDRPLHNVVAANRSRQSDENTFRSAFVYALSESGLGIKEVSERSGVSRDVINKLLSREGSSTTIENGVALAGAFGFTVEQLMLASQVQS